MKNRKLRSISIMSNCNRVDRDPHKKTHAAHVAPAGGRGCAPARVNLYIIITPPTKFFAITPYSQRPAVLAVSA